MLSPGTITDELTKGLSGRQDSHEDEHGVPEVEEGRQRSKGLKDVSVVTT